MSTGVLPDAAVVRSLIDEAHGRFSAVDDGENSSVYPALQRADPSLFGVCVAGTNGTVHAAGDADIEFSITTPWQ